MAFTKKTLSILLLCSTINLFLQIQCKSGLFDPRRQHAGEPASLIDLQGLTKDLLRKMSRKAHCVAIICDKIYGKLFTADLFQDFTRVTYFMVIVKDSEDLLSPNYDTLESISQIRRDGCESYLIMLANAVQTTRLLIFGDRHRILDTRAQFAMLHDYRLFAPPLHYLWSRIVNVIFVRRYVTRNPAHPVTWFEISTVPFPSSVRGILLVRRLDWWRKGGFRNGVNLFRDKTKDLLGHALKVAVLPHTPAAVKISTKKKIGNTDEVAEVTQFSGLEIEMIRALSSAMNFTAELYEPSDFETEQWGRRQLNGTFTGLLGEMVGGYADFALADLHYTPYHLQHMDLSIPYGTECLTFLTPEARYDNSWMTLILPFKPNMWAAVLTSLFFGGFIFYALATYHKSVQFSVKINQKDEKRENKEKVVGLYIFGELINSILYSWGMLLVVSLPKLPTGWSLRMLTGWYWIYCVLVVCSYRASMTAILANPAPRVTIDTLEELAENPISCGGWGEQSREFFLTSLDNAGQKIGAKFETADNAAEAVARVATGQFAYYENIHFLKAMMLSRRKNIANEEKLKDERNLHIMEECAINMPISIGLQKNSPMKKRADRFLRRVIESGLSEKWLSDVIRPVLASNIKEEPREALMDLRKLYGALIALGVGFTFSFIALIGEIIHWKYVTTKNPKFDKYSIKEYYEQIKK